MMIKTTKINIDQSYTKSKRAQFITSLRNIDKEHYRHLVYFIFVGGISAAIYFLLLMIFLDYMGVGRRIAVSASFAVSTLFNFMANRNLTFKQKDSSVIKHSLRYVVMLLISYVLTMIIVEIGSSVFNQTVYVGSIVAIFISMFFRFALSKFWVFT